MEGFKAKAKAGDRIQSFNVNCPPDPTRTSYVGRVIKVEVDPRDGVEYVYYVADSRVCNGIVERSYEDGDPTAELRAPQNGTETWLGRVCDGIKIID